MESVQDCVLIFYVIQDGIIAERGCWLYKSLWVDQAKQPLPYSLIRSNHVKPGAKLVLYESRHANQTLHGLAQHGTTYNTALKKVLRKSGGLISKIKCFVGCNLILHQYYIQNVKDGIQI